MGKQRMCATTPKEEAATIASTAKPEDTAAAAIELSFETTNAWTENKSDAATAIQTTWKRHKCATDSNKLTENLNLKVPAPVQSPLPMGASIMLQEVPEEDPFADLERPSDKAMSIIISVPTPPTKEKND